MVAFLAFRANISPRFNVLTNMQGKDYDIRITSKHRVRFTRNAFNLDNRLLIDLLETNGQAKVLTFIDQ